MPEQNIIGHVILEDFSKSGETKIVREDKRRVVAEAVVQTAEEENRNGRSYLTADLQREITCPRTMELIASGTMWGESGHPLDNNIMRQQTIVPDNCPVRYLKFWMEGNNVMALVKGTNNALGEAFDLDLRDGVKPAYSLRALGSLETIRGRNIVTNLRMITYDNVIYPSHPGAYTKGIVSESGNMSAQFCTTHLTEATMLKNKDKTKVEDHYRNKNGMLIPITNSDIVSYIKSESANIKSIINQIDVFYDSIILTEGGDIQMTTKAGDTFIVYLEKYIQNEIYNYCDSIYHE